MQLQNNKNVPSESSGACHLHSDNIHNWVDEDFAIAHLPCVCCHCNHTGDCVNLTPARTQQPAACGMHDEVIDTSATHPLSSSAMTMTPRPQLASRSMLVQCKTGQNICQHMPSIKFEMMMWCTIIHICQDMQTAVRLCCCGKMKQVAALHSLTVGGNAAMMHTLHTQLLLLLLL
jgi:hypothetical protein